MDGGWEVRPGTQPDTYRVAQERPGWTRYAGPVFVDADLAQMYADVMNAQSQLPRSPFSGDSWPQQ